MNAMIEMAMAESALAKRTWDTGGSDLYAPEMPVRARPKPKPISEKIVEAKRLPTFDEALEHVNWCRWRGMSPQCVAESIGHKGAPCTTWGQAVALIEGQAQKMRVGK